MANHSLVWHTRPREDGEAFASLLAQFGIESMVSPVLRVHANALPPIPDAPPDALLITSRNAAHGLGGLPDAWRALPVYCVGQATADSARKQAFTRVTSGSMGVEALLHDVVNRMPRGSSLLYLAGDETRVDVASLLNPHAITVQTLVVYHTTGAEALSDEVIAALTESRIRAVTFFSPRSAHIACDLILQTGLSETVRTIDAYCLSPNVAKEARKLTWANVRSCDMPNTDAMRELIVSYHGKT